MMCAIEYRGLCASCKNSENCSYARDPGQCIVNCDEFEGIRTPGSSARKSYSSSGACAASAEYNHEAPLGLCRTCEKAGECGFQKPEGGVWNCEEYK
jgi:hypothetical protein